MPSLKNNDITSKEKLQEKKLIGTKPKLKANKKENGNNSPLPGNPTEDYCFPDLFQTTPNTENAYVVVEGGECDGPIIYAASNSPQRLSEDVHEIMIFHSGDWWLWTDEDGTPETAQIGDPIEYGLELGKAGGTMSLFKIIYNTQRIWEFGEDLGIYTSS